jgi:hypothetical protein
MNNQEQEKKSVAAEVQEKLLGYITAALGLVAGLAWNDAIKDLITWLYPRQSNSLTAKFSYAVIITLIVVLISVYLARIAQANILLRKRRKK